MTDQRANQIWILARGALYPYLSLPAAKNFVFHYVWSDREALRERKPIANKPDMFSQYIELISKRERQLHVVDAFFDLVESLEHLFWPFRSRVHKGVSLKSDQRPIPAIDPLPSPASDTAMASAASLAVATQQSAPGQRTCGLQD